MARAEQPPNATGPVNSPPARRLGLPASALHQVDRSAALTRVDSLLGPAEEWKSPIIGYRQSSDWQEDWKEEVGHWIETADRHGFREALVKRILAQDGIDGNRECPRQKRTSQATASSASPAILPESAGAVCSSGPRHVALNFL